MKKILTFLAIIAVAALWLPVFGNKLAEDEIKNKVDVLVSYGVEVSSSVGESNYFRTKKHYEFFVKDREKFIKYLSQFTDVELPAYIYTALDGLLIGVDISYSNFPISDGISLDVYPLSLSEKVVTDMTKSDKDFYIYVKNLLQDKAILLHLSYDIVNNHFEGYIKDIKEEHLFKDKSKIVLQLSNASYEGSGVLFAPESFASEVEYLELKIIDNSEELSIKVQEFVSDSTFTSQNTYASEVKLNNIVLDIKSLGETTTAKASDLYVSVSSDMLADKGEFVVKSSLDTLDVKAKSSTFQASDFHYDITLSNIDKIALEKLQKLLSQAKVSPSLDLEDAIEQSGIDVISKGFRLSLTEFSVGELTPHDAQMMEGFSFQATMDFKEDPNVALKMQISPILLIQNMDMDAKLKLSKDFFAFLNQRASTNTLINTYAKEERDDLVFNIKFKQGELTINDKKL